jgi:hypothetical protein
VSCRVCKSEHRGEIEQALANGLGVREIAKMFGLSKSAVHRHTMHVPKSQEATMAPPPLDSQMRAKRLRATLERLLERAERAGDFRAATMIAAQISEIERRILDRVPGKLRGEDAPVLRIIFDDPGGGTGSVNASENLAYCIAHYGWQPILASLLRCMVGEKAKMSERLRAQVGQLLEILIDDYPEEATRVEQNQ